MLRNSTLILIHCTILALMFCITSCSGKSYTPYMTADDHYGLTYKYNGYYKVGSPYTIKNKSYKPNVNTKYSEVGIASWYGPGFHGKKTANGGKYDKATLTAAHKTLPMPSMVRVTNLKNGKSVILMVHDRGPYVKNRIIDVSERASEILGFKEDGFTKVKVDYLPHETNLLLAELGMSKTDGSSPNKSLGNTSIFAKAMSLHKYSAIQKNMKPESNPNVNFMITNMLANDKHFIQIGSFKNYKAAQTAANSIKHMGKVEIITLENDGKRIFRVKVGPFPEKKKLDYTLTQVIDTGYINAIVVR